MTFAIWTFMFMGLSLYSFAKTKARHGNGNFLDEILHGGLLDVCSEIGSRTQYVRVIMSVWWTGALLKSAIWLTVAVLFGLGVAAVSSATVISMMLIAFGSVFLGDYIFSMLFVFVSAVDVSREINKDNSRSI